jgi:hypothetical protein
MRKLKGLLIISFITIFSISAHAQSLSKLSDIQLEAKKQEAIVSENFELANQIKIEQDSRRSIDDKLKEKNKELTIALQQEDFAKAEILKKEIKQLEDDKAKLLILEEDKKIAIFQEDYDKVIVLETEINNLKRGVVVDNNTPIENKVAITTANKNTVPFDNAFSTLINNKNITAKPNLKKVSLSEVGFKDKTISQAGIGFGSITESYQSYDYFTNSNYTETYSEGIFAMSFLTNRWWLNKYLAGGWNLDVAPSDYGSIAVGGQMSALGDFDAIILPYTSLGLGFGMNLYEEEIYFPFVFRIGSYLFFNKNRNIGLFTEFNLYVNQEYMPKVRFGLAWSSIKKRAKR